MKKTLAILLAFVMILGLAACGSKTTEAPATTTPTQTTTSTPTTPATTTTTTTPATTETAPVRENEERYGGDIIAQTTGISTSMDPHFGGTMNSVLQWQKVVFEGPVVTGSDGQVYPLMCDYEYAEDGSYLKFTMREYYFSNGDQVTIDDVVASIERAGNRPSFVTKFWNYVDDVKVEGDSVTYTFNGVCPILLTNFGDIEGPAWVMPKEICEKYPDGEITDINDVIGTGPYYLEKYEPETEIVLTRNEYYNHVDAGGPGPASTKYAYADHYIFEVNTDAASYTAAMIAGEYTVGSVSTEMQPYAEQIGLQKWTADNNWRVFWYFNLSEENKGSIIQNKDFRKAIRAALDCEAAMFAYMNGDAERVLLEPIPVALSNTTYYNTIYKDSVYNLKNKELAKEYLEKSGYNGEEITILCVEGSGNYRMAMVEIPLLEEIGINVNMLFCDSGSHTAMRNDPAAGYDIALWDTQAAFDNPYSANSPVQGIAQGWWSNEEKQECVDIIGNTPNGSPENIAAWEKFEEIVCEECPYVGFGGYLSRVYTCGDFVLDYQGPSSYYWNSYFVK